MRKLIVVAHISLDGFVAGANGELDGFEAGEENLEFVCKLTEDADAAMFGRISYQLLDRYWPTAKDRPNATSGEIAYSTWYNSARKIVISRTLGEECSEDTSIISEDFPNEIVNIKRKAGRNILIFGSPSVVRELIPLDPIDEYWIFINPVIFGDGIPMFAGSTNRVKLKLMDSVSFSNGEIALHYIVDRS
jgi:dihydrofolate reductase